MYLCGVELPDLEFNGIGDKFILGVFWRHWYFKILSLYFCYKYARSSYYGLEVVNVGLLLVPIEEEIGYYFLS